MEWIIINVIESILLSWFISSLVDIKCKKWLYRFLLAVVNLSIITLSNYINMYDIFLTSFLIVCNVLISLCFVSNDISFLIFIMCLENVFNSTTIILSVIINNVFNLNIIHILGKFIYFVLGLLLSRYLKKSMFFLKNKSLYILSIVLFGIHFVMQHFLQIYLILSVQVPELLISFIMLFLCVIGLFMLLVRVSYVSRQEEEYKRLKQEKKNEETLSYLYDQLKITKHDFDLLNYYVEVNNYEKIKDFIISRKTMIDYMPTLIQSNNNLLNTIINNKIIQAHTKNIQVECHIIVNEFINMVDYDLNELLSNILDNAIENCLTQGRIIIDIVQEDLFLHIRVKNDNSSKNFSKELITKKDKESHGFGLKSIKRIINQYQGTYSIENNEEYYEIKITLLSK